MGTYVVTGSASGMGAAVAERLRGLGHRVIGTDVAATADVVADLSTAEGRNRAVAEILAGCGGRLDGAVLAAGLGPVSGRPALRKLAEVNYLGVVEVLEGLRPALASAENAKVVVFGSNSSTTTPAVPGTTLRGFARRDTDRVLNSVRVFGRFAGPIVYAGSKIAISRWVRRTAVTAEWAGAGIRLNVLAPGAVRTPLLDGQLASPTESRAIARFPLPVGDFGAADTLAQWAVFMLSDAADFLCGSIIFVDGGSDAYLRPDDWPAAVPLTRIGGYLARFVRYRRPA